MGQELGKAVSGTGDFYYNEDKGCFLKIQDGVNADCMLKTKLVYKISVYCEKNKNLISIDEIVCGEKISDINSFKKLCSEVTIDDGFYLRKSNSFFWVDKDLVVTRLGIVSDNEGLGEEGEGAYSAENCIALNKEKS